MADRAVTQDDIDSALSRPSGDPAPGRNGNIQVQGYASGGRILKIVLTPDRETIVTLAWPDE
jgi:hypothetical protein